MMDAVLLFEIILFGALFIGGVLGYAIGAVVRRFLDEL